MDIEAGRMDRPPAPRGFWWPGLWLWLWLDRRPCAGGPTPCGVLNRELCTRGLSRELRPNSPAYVRALRENSDVPRAASTRAGATVARLHTSPPLVGISAPDAGLGACFLSIAEKSAGRVRSGRSGLPTSVCLRQFAHVSFHVTWWALMPSRAPRRGTRDQACGCTSLCASCESNSRRPKRLKTFHRRRGGAENSQEARTARRQGKGGSGQAPARLVFITHRQRFRTDCM